MKLKNNYVNLYKFTINSVTYVMENNYISGEGREVNWYSEVKNYFTDQLDISKINDYIIDFIEDNLYFSRECLKYSDWYDINRVLTYTITDENSNEVTFNSDLYKKFKNGEKNLYTHNIHLTLFINDCEVKKEDMELVYSYLKKGGE